MLKGLSLEMMMTAVTRIAFLASTAEPAQRVRQQLMARYGDYPIEEADVLCALGAMASCCRPCIAMGQAANRCMV